MLPPEAVRKVADLTRLELNEDEVAQFSHQLSSILEYIAKLNELDTSDIEPLFSPVQHCTVLREDIVSQEYSRQELLANAPHSDGRYFIVPKII